MTRVVSLLTLCVIYLSCMISFSSSIHLKRPDRFHNMLVEGQRRPQLMPFSSDGEHIEFPSDSSERDISSMKTLFSWKQLDFNFPNSSMREQMIANQQFIQVNTLILDTDIYEAGSVMKVFVTLPRVRPGVPVTLATISNHLRKNGEYLLEPYPNWDAHTALTRDSCDGITSVFRVHIDECERLWVLDSGSINGFTSNASVRCQPKVLLYDLRNNNLIGMFPIPESMTASNSLLVTIAADIRRSQCDDAFAYIADAIAYKMIVFDLRNQQFWRINSIQFFAYPDQSRFIVNEESFDLFGGIFGLGLGPVFEDRRLLYFHSIDSVKQSWVDTADLRNQTLWRDNMNAKPRAFNLFNGSRPSQSTADVMNEQGIMFFGLVGSNEIACWDTQTPFTDENIVRLAKDDRSLQFVSGIKLSKNKLYAVTGRLQKYLNNNVNSSDVNYRVLQGDVSQMTRATKCGVRLDDRLDVSYKPHLESVEAPTGVLNNSKPPCNIHSLVCLQ